MAIVNILKKILPKQFKDLIREQIARRSGVPSMQWSLENMCRLGFRPAGVVDIGAYEGEWTLMARKIFPRVPFLMIEAQTSKREVLEQIKRQYPATIGYRIALLGERARDGVIFHQLENAPTASSILSDHAGTAACDLVCKMEVLDHVLMEESLQRPELIKIDVQGYELEVLKGATETLAKAHAIMMEVSLIELYKGNPLLNEAIGFMHQKGFRPYDICTLNRRSLDNALVQADMIFLKNDSFLLAQKTWA